MAAAGVELAKLAGEKGFEVVAIVAEVAVERCYCCCSFAIVEAMGVELVPHGWAANVRFADCLGFFGVVPRQ